MKNYVLKNGFNIPAIGLGAKNVWMDDSDDLSILRKKEYEIYAYAMSSNKCKLFDTSESYGENEEILGEALVDTGSRDNVILMTKIGNKSQQGKVRKAFERSLKRLKTDYIDIYLIHWPQTGTFVSTWLEIEKLYEEGLVKAIGVCNCNKHHIAAIRKEANVMPMINEIEVHPLFTQDALVNYCFAKDIQVVAYTPVGRMHDVLIRSNPVRTLSNKYGVTEVQLILRWHYQLGRVSIPSTLNKEHFDQIFDIDSFEITEKDMAWISSLNENTRLRYNSDTCDFSWLG